MPQNNTLSCPPNEKVSIIAKRAGYSNANSMNSFAFSNCGSSECADILPLSGCSGALHCINQENTEVYTVCTSSESNSTMKNNRGYGFAVLEKRWTVFDDVSLLAIKARLPRDRKSIQEDWCQDYAKLCESYGLRPTGSDIIQDHEYTSCRDKYGSVMMDRDFFGSKPQSKISNIVQQGGMSSANTDNSFGLIKCTRCPSVLTASNCEGLGCIKPSHHNDVYTICIKPQSNFDIFERKTTVYNKTSYLVMKAKMIAPPFSNLAEDYDKTCLNHGRRPLLCKKSLQNTVPTTSSKLSSSEAKSEFISSTKTIPRTSSELSTSQTKSEFTSSTNTVPTTSQIEFSPSETTKSMPSGSSISVTTLPYCPDNDKPNKQLLKIASNAGFVNATSTNIYTSDSFEIKLTSSIVDVYLICVGPDSNFDVISTKPVDVLGQEYLVIEGKLPQNGLALYENWCEDFKQLCISYGKRPLGCGKESNGLPHTTCRDTYDAILSQDDSAGCPSNLLVSSVANQAGYSNATARNSFAFSICNESSCSKNFSNTKALYGHMKSENFTTPSIGPNQTLYTLCLGSNTSFTVESHKDVSYRNGVYRIIKARTSLQYISNTSNLCRDYQALCISYGWKPLMTSRNNDVSCHRNYEVISPVQDEVPGNEKFEYLVKTAGYENAIHENILTFRKNCKDSCVGSFSNFSKNFSQNNNVMYAVCIKSDTNFYVLDSNRVNYQNRLYLVLKTRIPRHGFSKQETWCNEYKRLCGEHGMRPVTFLSRDSRAESCIPDYMSVVVPRNNSLNLFTRERVSLIANAAGYSKASRDNSFAFSECNLKSCPRFLASNCVPGLDCLSSEPSELYTVCTDTNSSFVAEETRSVNYKGIPYLVIRANTPTHGISKHNDWCLDYKILCNSFGMQPVVCKHSQSVLNCSTDFAAINNSCGLKNLDLLRELIDENFLRNSSLFMPEKCGKCTAKPKTFSLLFCTALQNNFKVMEVKQIEYQNARLSVVKARVLFNGTSFQENWGYDYSRMCSTLGKRPFSCHTPGNIVNYKSRELYDVFLSDLENCSDIITLKSLANKAGFPQVKNLLFFDSSLIQTNKFVKSNVSMAIEVARSPEKYWSCKNPLVIHFQNESRLQTWKKCVELKLKQVENVNLTQNCSIARDCFNDTQLAGNACDVISKCYYSDCNESCPSLAYEVHMSECPTGKKCSDFNTSEEVYAFCSDFSDSNFDVEYSREVVYADQPYTVVKAHVPSHGQSRSETWCEDYKNLCLANGKRPVGCGKNYEVLKQSRDCRIHYNAIMITDMSCPSSEEIAAIAKHAGFSATVNESLGLWNCAACSKNFSKTWNKTYSPEGTNLTYYVTNTSFNVYLLCAGSDSNFNVLEKRAVKHRGSPVSVVMVTIPHHGRSLHENWCVDYLRLCQSYGQRPIGCGKSADNIEAHARCRDGYNAIMYSDDTIHCSEEFKINEIVKSAGFTAATSQNSFIFKSCLAQHCTKFLPSEEHPYTKYEISSTDRILYTLCASSDSAYNVIATRPVTVEEQDYLVIRASIPVDGQSKHTDWCEDYKRLCEGYAMKPLTCKLTTEGSSSPSQRKCMYNFEAITKSNTDLVCPAKTGVASIAKQAGFDHVNDTNSFAMDSCDPTTSCAAKMPNIKCVDVTHYDSVFETKAKQAELTRVDYIVNTTKTTVVLNQTVTYTVPEERHCFIVPSAPNGEPSYMIGGEKLKDIFSGNTCMSNMDLNSPTILLTYFNKTVNQTFEHKIPRVETNCWFLSANSLSRMSEEATTVCIRPWSDTNFKVQSTRRITSSGREYLIIQTKLLSANPKSINWCMEYAQLCKSFRSSPLACPRKFGFHAGNVKCVSNYGAIMMNDVDYACPSNGFVSQLAHLAGYNKASLANSFSLADCDNAKCTSELPLTGCSDAVHCLSHEVLHDYVYTACVAANSDSSFNVIEKREKRLSGHDYTVIRAQLPVDGAPLFESWCQDYQYLCQSFNLRPLHCNWKLSESEYGICKQKYSSAQSYSYSCPVQIYKMAWEVGFSGTSNSAKNYLSFHECSKCSKTLESSTCDQSLNCLTSSVTLREVYTSCGATKSKSSFQPLATKDVRHGYLRLRVIQAKVISQSSAVSDWGKDYQNLCDSYSEKPTGCGVLPGESNAGVSECERKYSSHVLKGNELGCNPNDVISKLARDAGFVNAHPNNSFGFSSCDGTVVSQLSSNCHGSLPCLTWNQENPIVYTVCFKSVESNFEVLAAKTIMYNFMEYLVINAKIPEDGRSYQSNWCDDYKELCTSYNMLPTGCGGDSVEYSNYSSCNTGYASYMPANNILKCGDTTVVSRIANKAGFQDAISANSFVFHSCDKCSKELTDECDGALNCINKNVWQRRVYTVCVNPTTSFNVRDTATTTFNNAKFLVLEAKLPEDGRAKSGTWCREYERLCKRYNARPLACHKEDNYMECTRKYAAKQTSFSCNGNDVSNIAVQAGFSKAKQGNTFIFNNCNKCSKTLISSGCDDSLSCINSNIADYVYVVCTKDQSNFKILDVQKVPIPGAVYTVVSALPAAERSSTSWCTDYSELCHTIGQSPVALHSGVVTEQLSKCRDDYDAVIQKSHVSAVHLLARQAGYNDAEYGNTFAFKDCSFERCQSSSYSYNCSESLHCLNGLTQKVHALCIENTQVSNFYVLENKTVYSNDSSYTVLKVRIPMHRLSKFESWCRDYERLCHAHEMRPITSVSSRECSVEYFSIFASKFQPQTLISVVHLAGFKNATTSDIFTLEKCDGLECKRQFGLPQCVHGSGCSKSINQQRIFYALCHSLDENLQTNFEIHNVRNVWLNAAFLVAQVKIPSHRQSRTENWCYEYQTFCKSYDRQTYTTEGTSTNTTIKSCSWKYNATMHSTGISPGSIVERAGFVAVSPACVASLNSCNYCEKLLSNTKCPFEKCKEVVEKCDDVYIICT